MPLIKSVFCQNVWVDRSGFWHDVFLRSSTYVEIRSCTRIRVLILSLLIADMIRPRQCVQRKQYNFAAYKKEHRIAPSAKEPRLEAVLFPASGSASGPASRPSPRSGTPILRALPAQTSHEHVGPWVVNNQVEFMCLRESSDSADPFIAATAIQLTPSYTAYFLLELRLRRAGPSATADACFVGG